MLWSFGYQMMGGAMPSMSKPAGKQLRGCLCTGFQIEVRLLTKGSKKGVKISEGGSAFSTGSACIPARQLY